MKEYKKNTYICVCIYINIYVCVCVCVCMYICFPGGLAGKESAYNVGDQGSIPELGRSPGEGNSYPL